MSQEQTNVDIQQHIRKAAAFELAAGKHEDKYENAMKSAGAEMFSGWHLALCAAHPDRKIDEKRAKQLYALPQARPWWDAHLEDAGVKGGRKQAQRLMQWHIDPLAAASQRAIHTQRQVAYRKKVDKQRTAESRDARASQGESSLTQDARNAEHSRRITEANITAALGGRELQNFERQFGRAASLDDLLKECSRITAEVRKVHADDRGAALQILQQVRLV